MTEPNAKIIAHSKAPNGEELVTMEIELHRFILPEFNTHRSLSRNFQSSRAVPVKKMIEQVRKDPATPVHWGRNQRGMVAEGELDGENLVICQDQWKAAAREAASKAEAMDHYGAHKQIVNRLLEPFMWTKGVVTATVEALEAFFLLRRHKDAQPEIKALADAMWYALEESSPRELNYGDFHLPYFGEGFWDKRNHYYTWFDGTTSGDNDFSIYLDEAIKISTSCCAQVSYRALDQSIDKAIKIYDMLNLPVRGEYPEDPPHFSPTEHVVKVVQETNSGRNSGNLHSNTFWQYRKALETGVEKVFMEEK